MSAYRPISGDQSAPSRTEPVPPLLTEAQRRELERRVAEDDANPDDVVPWEQVLAFVTSGLVNRPGN
jgi:putative addiction module component (TIGR02574 family)